MSNEEREHVPSRRLKVRIQLAIAIRNMKVVKTESCICVFDEFNKK